MKEWQNGSYMKDVFAKEVSIPDYGTNPPGLYRTQREKEKIRGINIGVVTNQQSIVGFPIL